MFSVVERMLYTDMQDHAEARDCEALAHLGPKQQAMDLACH